MIPSRRRAIVVAATLALSVVGGGCRSSRTAATNDPNAVTTVRVENRGYLDRVIYLVASSQRIRLGTVTGNSTQVLRIPAQYVFGATQLQFIADPIGSNAAPISEAITVTPGDQIVLIIPPG